MKPPRFSSGRIKLSADWPASGVLVPSGTDLSFSDWRWNGLALPWPPPPACQALNQASYDELLKHYPAHMLSFRPQETQKFADEKPRREASMSMEQSIETAVALTKSLAADRRSTSGDVDSYERRTGRHRGGT
jgi:hypothetical protein